MVLDANILIRAALGSRVLNLLTSYSARIDFFAPDVAFADAIKYLPQILQKRGIDPYAAMAILESLPAIVREVEHDVYIGFEAVARQRLANRDEDDWPILATALALRHPIWTEDADFFGCGLATWTTDRVEIYLSELTS